MENRRFDLDNLKGILIILVVLGHFLLPGALMEEGPSYELFSIIYSFHMPLFIFISGLLTSEKLNKTSIANYAFLYFIFNFSLAIFDNLLNGTALKFTVPYYSMWFLICIIVYRLLASVLNSEKIFLLFIFSIILSVMVGFVDLGNIFALDKIFAFLPFFLLGYSLKNDIFKIKDNFSQKMKIVVFIGSILSFLLLFYFTTFKDFTTSFYMFSAYTDPAEYTFRVLLLVFNFIFIILIFFIVPNKKCFLSTIGKNSLFIFLIQRFITLALEDIFILDKYRIWFSIIMSISICVIFSLPYMTKNLNRFFGFLYKKKIYIFFFLTLYLFTYNYDFGPSVIDKSAVINIDNTVKISYVGDLLLFEDELEKAKVDNTYDFSPLFENTKDYFGDYTFGVLEGPVSDNYYSVGNYIDNRLVSFNYPYEYLEEISKHIDFVDIGTNHILDRGKDGLNKTLENLEKSKIDYTGAFNSENHDIKIIDIEGIKIAVLSYTYGVNDTEQFEDYMINEFDENQIKEDILEAKSLNVDKIFVMSHIGTQFSHKIDAKQDYYNKYFASLGVDVVLSDHAHATQPIQYINDTLIFNCPGNYVSSFTAFDGGYSAICNMYIDKSTKEIKTASIVPLTASKSNELTVPVVAYEAGDIFAFNKVSETMINKSFNYCIPEIFYSKKGYSTVVNKGNDTSEVLDYINNSSNICFIGDSITEGTKNDFHPWFEYLNLNNYCNVSIGGATSESILKNIEDAFSKKSDIINSDLFVIAIGTNDIRYNNLESSIYIENLEKIVNYINKNSMKDDIKFVFVNPWYFLDSDKVSIIDISIKNDILDKYDESLQDFCNDNGFVHVNANNYLEEFFNENRNSLYMLDGIHPNIEGVKVYSKAFLYGENNLEILNKK